MVHNLKILPEYFQAIAEGRKTFDVRKNDRGYKPHDLLVLREFVPADWFGGGSHGYFTHRVLLKKISYILPGGVYGVDPDYVVLSLSDPENYELTPECLYD